VYQRWILKEKIFYIAFYPEEGKFDFSTLRRGSVVRIDRAKNKYFADGTYGLRIENLDSIRAYPIPFDKLKYIDDKFVNEELHLDGCWTSHREKTEPDVKLSLYGRCKLACYCSQDCQKQHWAEHKKTCKGQPLTTLLHVSFTYFD
jgi:hypothetical protein